MLNSVRSFVKIVFTSSLVLMASAGLVSQASGQTVLGPQLLPVGPVTILAGGAASSPANNAPCATGSSLTSTDKFGDGCLATQVAMTGPRYVIQDKSGNFFISDTSNSLIRRVDATTGIITLVAGSPTGATTSPSSGTPCGLNSSTDIFGDGCNSTLVSLFKPEGLAFSPTGDLYFVDGSHDVIRKIAATDGLIPATGGGIISNVAGFAPTTGSATFGYVVSNSTTAINAATQSYIDGPFGLAFDKNGILYAADEFKNAIYAINVTATDQMIYGVDVKAGQIWKVVGTTTAAGAGTSTSAPVDCPNASTGTSGCNFITSGYTEGGAAGANPLDSPYGVAFDPAGNLFIANEFTPDLPVVSPAGLISTYAGAQSSGSSNIASRAAAAGNFFGSTFGVTADNLGVVYFTDAFNGVVWRVDPDTKVSYVVAGGVGDPNGASAVCSTATDTAGDGCPALQASFGKSGAKFATSSSPGIFGISVDQFSNLYVGDSLGASIREIGNGTSFGNAGLTTLMVHYFKGDSPKTDGYVVAPNTLFEELPGNCTQNADGSQDCALIIQSTPTALGPYSGTLTVTSTAGGSMVYPLTGNYVPSSATTTKLSFTTSTATCSSGTYSTATSFTFTAIVARVGSNVTGQVQFYNDGVAIGSPVTPVQNVATLTTTFSNPGTFNITATFLGDSSFATSTSAMQAVTVQNSTLYLTANSTMQSTVTAGQTALYSFNTTSSVYGGQVAFACTGLPANATCVFSPSVLSSDACSTGSTVALSIFTKAATAINTAGPTGRGKWPMLLMLAGLVSALMIGLRRRQLGMRLGSVSMAFALLLAGTGLMSCAEGVTPALPATPKGTYTITVTALPVGTVTVPAGQSLSITFPLVVN